MELTDTQLCYFVDHCLKLPKGKRAEFLGQVDNLIGVFSSKAADDPVVNIKKFLKTGSLMKGTVLRPRGGRRGLTSDEGGSEDRQRDTRRPLPSWADRNDTLAKP